MIAFWNGFEKSAEEKSNKKRHALIGATAGGLAGATGAGFRPGMKTKGTPGSMFSQALRPATNKMSRNIRGDRRKALLLMAGILGAGGAAAGGLAGLATGHLADKAKKKKG